jgi:hypothetical protein
MSPSHAAKGGSRWRYYVSQALLQGRKQDAGSVARVPAAEIEQRVTEAISSYLTTSERSIVDSNARTFDPGNQTSFNGSALSETFGAHHGPDEHAADLRDAIERVTISRSNISIHLTDAVAAEGQARTLTVRWTPPSSTPRREIIQGAVDRETSLRPMRVKARAGLVEALRKAYCWLDELLDDPRKSVETIAARERKTERSIRMTLSLAFLSPDIVKATIEGRLPRGFGVTRLVDLPMAWSDQWLALGLKAPAAV